MNKNMIISSVALLLIMSVMLIINSHQVNAGFSNITVVSLTEKNYSNIWLGISTGGYALITPINNSYTFRIFVKNGMGDASMHNLAIAPRNFPFQVNSIKPKTIDQIKPMEIVIFYVNATIPENATLGKYPIIFDVYADEFPSDVFKLSSEITVVQKIDYVQYGIYLLIAIGLIIWLFVRKNRMLKEMQGRAREPE